MWYLPGPRATYTYKRHVSLTWYVFIYVSVVNIFAIDLFLVAESLCTLHSIRLARRVFSAVYTTPTPPSVVQAYIQETLAFCDCLVNDKPSPCSGEDGLMALIMAIAAGMSAEENRWVR